MCVSVFVCVVGGTGELWRGRQGKLKKLRKVACKGGKVFENAAEGFFCFVLCFFFIFFATDRSGTAKCKHTEHDH